MPQPQTRIAPEEHRRTGQEPENVLTNAGTSHFSTLVATVGPHLMPPQETHGPRQPRQAEDPVQPTPRVSDLDVPQTHLARSMSILAARDNLLFSSVAPFMANNSRINAAEVYRPVRNIRIAMSEELMMLTNLVNMLSNREALIRNDLVAINSEVCDVPPVFRTISEARVIAAPGIRHAAEDAVMGSNEMDMDTED